MSMRLRQFIPLDKGYAVTTAVSMSGPVLVLFLLWTLASALALMAFDFLRTPVRTWRVARRSQPNSTGDS